MGPSNAPLSERERLTRLVADLQECLALAYISPEPLSRREIEVACIFLRETLFLAKVEIEDQLEELPKP